MSAEHRLWAANPHQFGPGKVHIVDESDETKTFCGRFLDAIPGSWSGAKQATCRVCLDAVVGRPRRAAESERYQREAEARRAEIERQRAAENQAWWDSYNAYLKSDAWKARRSKVLQRADGVCEGCMSARAVEVHHTTYKHVGSEFLWELRAVCKSCHEQVTTLDREARR